MFGEHVDNADCGSRKGIRFLLDVQYTILIRFIDGPATRSLPEIANTMSKVASGELDFWDEWRVSERLRQLKCPYEDFDYATMDSEGHMYVHPHFTRYPNVTTDVKCKAPENTRFYANADAFYIRCYQNKTVVFEKAFAGMRDLTREKNKVYLSDETKSFDRYGRRRRKPSIPDKPKRYSVDILGFDSTSRTMFMRHMPRTLELMDNLGYEIFYGYNK
ncbi:hypothetical protein TELCIR_15181, partial [Teladorsagia circumcincta]